LLATLAEYLGYPLDLHSQVVCMVHTVITKTKDCYLPIMIYSLFISQGLQTTWLNLHPSLSRSSQFTLSWDFKVARQYALNLISFCSNS